MRKRTLEQACKSYFKRGKKEWDEYFSKWEEKAAEEDIDEADMPTSEDESIHSEVVERKRRRYSSSDHDTPVKKKKKDQRLSCTQSFKETIEIEEKLSFSVNNSDFISYFSELAKQFSDSTGFCMEDFSNFRSHSESMIVPYNPVTPLRLKRQFTDDAYYSNFLTPCVSSRMHYSPIADSYLFSSTPMPLTQLCLPAPSNALSPISQSPKNSCLTIIESDDSDDDSPKRRSPVPTKKSEESRAVKRCLALKKDDDEDDSSESEDFI